ncbi:scaffold/adaptor protein [Lithospermum erythrorhizon]|uniref:Scaffold/adaptor protein n=1 Tax=Lithospermum erythrorhizon TaxID=34254 RepID=A0AAV3NSY7_LITER
MASSREESLYKAKLAEEIERFDEMVDFMKAVVNAVDFSSSELTPEERNFLSAAYKHVISMRRSALRPIMLTELKEQRSGEPDKAEKVREYRLVIEEELSGICREVLEMIEGKLMCEGNKKVEADAEVFYLKMKGDYNRYLAEFKDGSEKDVAAEKTLMCYKAAQEIAEAELNPTNSTRLGLALNFAVFYYEIMSSPDQACTLGKQAFDDAIKELDSLGEDGYKESTLIMQLLRDNLSLWTSELQKPKLIKLDDNYQYYSGPKR